MAVSNTQALADTVINIRGGKTRVKKIEILTKPASTLTTFVQVFNQTSVTLGTTAPSDVLQVTPEAAHAILGNSARGQRKQTYIFSGKFYGTGLQVAATTTHDGLTAPAAADQPQVRVVYEPIV